MAATDFIGGVYAKLWTLLEAHGEFTSRVRAGNRIKLDGTATDPFKEFLKDSDLPQVVIGLGSGSDSQYQLTAGYDDAYGATVSGLANVGNILQTYVITQITADLRIGVANPLTLEILTALRKGGPRLGLSYVKSWGPVTWDHIITSDRVNEYGDAAGTKRLVVSFSVPVMFQYANQSNLS